MDATTYTGNGSSQTITNAAGFQPDLVWIKSRSTGGIGHMLADSVRGTAKVLHSDQTAAEENNLYGSISSFNSNGFTTVAGSVNFAETGQSPITYVGWQWQAGQGLSSSNTNGTITSTVSVNASAGFSIVSYTGNGTAGATIGHGLGVAPKMLITFARNTATNHAVYHSSLGNTKAVKLNLTSAEETFSGWWNNTSPTSSVFSVGTFNEVNNLSTTYVAYCWSEIDGFSKFGSYTGNGSADGPFVYTGFRPKFVLFKRTDSSANWQILDSVRNAYNLTNLGLYPDLNFAEQVETNNVLDLISNGFKVRGTGVASNVNGGTYIYMAFAENPFKNSLAR
jgi:hypothetical protein